MFLSVIALALVTGALAGGGLPRLADLHLRAIWVLAIAVALRLGAVLLGQQPIGQDIPVAWGFVAAYLLRFLFMGANWRVPGMQIAAVGIGVSPCFQSSAPFAPAQDRRPFSGLPRRFMGL